MSGSSFTNIFGGVAIRPAQPSYLALTISADTALVWPLETTEGQPVVATQLDITATVGSLNLLMPPGNTGSTGVQSIVSNVGSDTFTVTDQAGNAITPIATTETWLITLIDNTTDNGTWRAIQIGATVSQATAAALAGLGLQANGSKLQVNWPTTVVSSSGAVGATARSTLLNWTGVTGTLQLGAHATLGVGFICAFDNTGTGVLTFTTTGGDTINGVSSLPVQPGSSGFLICTSSGFLSIGSLIGVLGIAQGGTGASTANGALTNFGGTTTGISIFTAPSAAAVVALLGLSSVGITEMTVSGDQALSPSSGSTAFMCTIGLTLTLPLTTSLTNKFSFLVYATNGPVALTPQASDTIVGTAMGDTVTIPDGGSAYVFTDANGFWYAAFMSLPLIGGSLTGALIVETGGLTIEAGGLIVVGGAAVAGGLIVSTGGFKVDAGGGTIALGGFTISAGGLNSTGVSTLDGAVTVVTGGVAIEAGGLDVVLGGMTVQAGGLTVSAAGALVTGDSTITGALTVTQPGTTGSEAINFTQFPNTLSAAGIQTLPGGLIVQWGTGSTTSGSGTVTFGSVFPNACLNVHLTIGPGVAAATLHPLIFGAPGTSGFSVFGDASESLGFSYFAIGH